jgi:hypothetical protein
VAVGNVERVMGGVIVGDVARRGHVDVVAEVPACEVADRGRCVCCLVHCGCSRCEAVMKGVATVKGKVVVGGGMLCLCCVCVVLREPVETG